MRQSQELTIMDYFTIRENLRIIGRAAKAKAKAKAVAPRVTLMEFKKHYFVEARSGSDAWINCTALPMVNALVWYAELCSGAKSVDQYKASVPMYRATVPSNDY